MTEYQSLQEFVAKVSDACAGVEDGIGKQTLNLVLFLEKIRDKCWADIKGSLSAYVFRLRRDFQHILFSYRSFLAASERLGWPMPVDYVAASPEDRKAFERAFRDLLKLQNMSVYLPCHHLYFVLFSVSGEKLRPPNAKERPEKDGLYPLQALIQPLSLRFKYHFEGTRQTNRLDKVRQPVLRHSTGLIKSQY